MHDDRILTFGDYRLIPARRSLSQASGEAVRLGSRAFDLLVALADRAGEVVPPAELMETAWPGRVLEDGSLRVHIAALRKVLGDGAGGQRYITNVPLRGYCFVATVTRHALDRHGDGSPEAPAAATPPASVAAASGLPLPLTRLVGRDESVDEVCQRLPLRRCLTLVGPGGIGKTSVALAAARRLAGVGFDVVPVELGALTDAAQVPQALASALGIVAPAVDPLGALAAYLRDKQRVLILLDNCEHLVGAVAELAEVLLHRARDLCILATSREALRIQGEWVQRLASLEAPASGRGLTAAEALAWPAVQLFCERAAAQADRFVLADDDVAAVCEVCRRVDGIPLAIELAASAADMVGLRNLAEQLGHHLALLSRGRRTALPRHQTLRATLDWSHALLTPGERRLLRRLAVFRGSFNLAAARAIGGAAPNALPGAEVHEALVGLVSKSLLVIDLQDDERYGGDLSYRLLETTREYAAEKLEEALEADGSRRAHAGFLLDTYRGAEERREQQAVGAGLPNHAHTIDDLRAATAWALGDGKAPALAVSLLAWSSALWFGLSLMPEYRALAEAALAEADAGTDADAAPPPVEVMRICEALGHALWHTRGGGPAMAASFRRALSLAEALGATPFRLRCLWGLWLISNTVGDYKSSVGLAEDFGSIVAASQDAGVQLTHDRMMALGLHYGGDQQRARHHAQIVLDHPLTINHTARNSGFQFDQRVAALTVLSRILWLQGSPEQALARASAAVEEALAIGHGLSICYAIANGSAPVAFWAGDMAAARRYTLLLRQHADERSLYFWQAFAEGYESLLGAFDGRPARPGPAHPATGTLLRETLVTVAPCFGTDDLFERAEQGLSGWCTAELLRVAGERDLQEGRQASAVVRFRRGLGVAEQQGALGWALRCAHSLARAVPEEGLPVLRRIRQRFTEGAALPDLRSADDLLGARSAVNAC